MAGGRPSIRKNAFGRPILSGVCEGGVADVLLLAGCPNLRFSTWGFWSAHKGVNYGPTWAVAMTKWPILKAHSHALSKLGDAMQAIITASPPKPTEPRLAGSSFEFPISSFVFLVSSLQ